MRDSSTRPMPIMTCCQRLAPESACLAETIAMTMPLWRASSRISKRKDSTLMTEIWMKHKEELKSIYDSTINIGHNKD